MQLYVLKGTLEEVLVDSGIPRSRSPDHREWCERAEGRERRPGGGEGPRCTLESRWGQGWPREGWRATGRLGTQPELLFFLFRSTGDPEPSRIEV